MNIMFFVMVIATSAPTTDGWVKGTYGQLAKEFSTIAACEQERNRIVGLVVNDKDPQAHALISLCAAPKDLVTYHSYRSTATSPVVSKERF